MELLWWYECRHVEDLTIIIIRMRLSHFSLEMINAHRCRWVVCECQFTLHWNTRNWNYPFLVLYLLRATRKPNKIQKLGRLSTTTAQFKHKTGKKRLNVQFRPIQVFVQEFKNSGIVKFELRRSSINHRLLVVDVW